MLHFLQEAKPLKDVLPDISTVKERLASDEMKLGTYVDRMIRTVIEYTPNVILAFIVFIIGMWVINRIARIAEKTMTRRDLEVSLRTFLKSLISIGLRIILIVTVAGMIGIGTASFVTILGAAGLAVGLALQGSLSNFAGGVLILIFKPFKVGDSIEAGGQSGEVREIQIFNTILLTGDHKTVILPNGPLSNGTIINTTRYGDLRLELEFRIHSENDIARVKSIIHVALANNKQVINPEKTEITIGKFMEGVIHIHVRPYCLPDNTSMLLSDLYENIKTAFDENHIRLANANLAK